MARDVARRALRRVERDGWFAAAALAEQLAGAGRSPADRALATEIVYGVLRHRTRLDRALVAATTRGRLDASASVHRVLRVAAYQLLMLDRVPAHAAVNDAVRAARRAGGARVGGFVNGLLRRLARQGEPAWPDDTDPIERAMARHSLPRWIAEQIAARVGHDELDAAAAGLNSSAPLSIRVRDARARTAVAEQLRAERAGVRVELVRGVDEALLVTGLGDPSASPSFRAGAWTVQDVGAQRVARLLAPRPGKTLLDACAGVGGKATHLAALTGDAADIDAADIDERKLAQLRATAARLGHASIRVVVADLTAADAPLADRYDGVLLDAPCTGLGVMRRHPEVKWRVTQTDVAAAAARQRRLLDALAPRAADVLVYAVCTFTDAEGPAQMRGFVHRHPGFRIEVEWTTWPHRDDADAFYAARLVRDGGRSAVAG